MARFIPLLLALPAIVLLVFLQANDYYGGPIEPIKVKSADEILYDDVAVKSQEEKREFKAALVKAASSPTIYSAYNMSIEIQQVNQIPGGVEVFARAWDTKGNQLGFVDGTVEIERFIILNPPIMVPDELGTIVKTSQDRHEQFVKKYRIDPEEALKQTLAHTISVSAKTGEKIVKGKVGHTTTTVYPDANPESTSVDAYMVRNNGGAPYQSFTDIRAGAGTGSDDTAASSIAADLFAGSGSSNTYQALYRAVYVYDTSSISDTDVVSSATISICSRSTKIDGLGGNGAVGITAGTTASNTAVANSDFESNTSGTRLADSDIDVGSWAADSTYNNWTLNASGLANISLTGVSKFASKLGFDIDNTTTGLTWSSSGEILARSYNADQAGTTCDPKLVVTHAAAAAPAVKKIQTVFIID